jgi:hypothetical protein
MNIVKIPSKKKIIALTFALSLFTFGCGQDRLPFNNQYSNQFNNQYNNQFNNQFSNMQPDAIFNVNDWETRDQINQFCVLMRSNNLTYARFNTGAYIVDIKCEAVR